MMISSLDMEVPELDSMRKRPDLLYCIGNRSLLQRRKISIVGSRKPTPYSRSMTFELASKLAKQGFCIVSGAAMGVDAIAHQGAGSENTIAVMAGGLDIRYPAVNRGLIASIEQDGLCISSYEKGFRPAKWSFVARNEIVAAFGEALIIAEADLNSGSLRSAEFAIRMGKPVYVFSHRMGESEGTNALLSEGRAEPIYSIDQFINSLGVTVPEESSDPLLSFCRNGAVYEDAAKEFGDLLFEYELSGKVEVVNGKVFAL